MAAVMKNLILSTTSDANFRDWGKGVSDQLAAFGWVKTADTGQIDWATVQAPAYNSARGYEVWRMNDALQAQAPVFLKIWYGSANHGYQGAPALWFQVGTGSSGAGALTGQVGTQVQQTMYNEPSPTVPYRCIFSGDAGRFQMCLGVNRDEHYHHTWFSIERSKDPAGADTAEGVYRCGSAYNGAHAQFLPMSGLIPPNEASIGCLSPGTSSGAVGTDVTLYPVYPFNIVMKPPARGVAGYFKADLPQDYVVEGKIYGLTQKFYAVGHAVPGPMLRGTGPGLLMRYE